MGDARLPTSTSISQSITMALYMRQHKWDRMRLRLRNIQVCIPPATGEVSITHAAHMNEQCLTVHLTAFLLAVIWTMSLKKNA